LVTSSHERQRKSRRSLRAATDFVWACDDQCGLERPHVSRLTWLPRKLGGAARAVTQAEAATRADYPGGSETTHEPAGVNECQSRK
jgi:hypothetical protein